MSSGSFRLLVDCTAPWSQDPDGGEGEGAGCEHSLRCSLAILSCFWLADRVIFSVAFFPFEKYGKKLILCIEDLDHIASDMFLKQNGLGAVSGPEGSQVHQVHLWTLELDPPWLMFKAILRA